MSHTSNPNVNKKCECEKLKKYYLLTQCAKSPMEKKVTDLYIKPSDRNQYLLPSSCSPATCTENIPFILALRIVRVCAETESREFRFQELKEFLLERSYQPGLVDAAIDQARTIPRAKALLKVDKPTQPWRPISVVTYNPLLPNIQNIHNKYWKGKTMKNPYLLEVFPEPPMVAFKRQ